MKRNFNFDYYFNNADLKTWFNYEITKTDIENTVKVYINNYNICKEDSFLINYNDNIEIEFDIVNITEDNYLIEVDNIYIID